MQKTNQPAESDVTHPLATDCRKKITERKLPPVEPFERLRKNHGVDGYQAKIPKQQRPRSDGAGIFLAVEVAEKALQVMQNPLWRGKHHVAARSQKVVAITRSPSRAVCAT